MSIQSFGCKLTAEILDGGSPRKFQAILRQAEKKLAILEAASCLADLKAPLSNRLHALKDDRKGQHSISINDQWRICFRWTDSGPEGVEIVDYH